MCAAVGTTSAANTAVFPPDSMNTTWWCAVWPQARTTRTPGLISRSSSKKSTTPAASSGATSSWM